MNVTVIEKDKIKIFKKNPLYVCIQDIKFNIVRKVNCIQMKKCGHTMRKS